MQNIQANIRQAAFIVFFFFGWIGSNSAFAVEEIPNYSLNKKNVLNGTPAGYSFFVSGHFHGSSNNKSGKPAKTVLANIERINADSVAFIISLGDLFLDIKNDIPTYHRELLSKLDAPVYNAPGNHDKSGTIYENNYGVSYFYFSEFGDIFILLDTELDDGSVTGAQLSMIKSVLKNVRDARNIFVFSHRLIWAEEHPEMKNLFTDNTRSSGGNNFRDELLPLFQNLGRDKNIFFMGGSLGNTPSPFFYHKEGNITYIATAIRDTPKDAFLKVDVADGKVAFSAFPLLMPIEYYDLKYYNSRYPDPPGFNLRLVPLYIKNMISHRYFWYGTGLTAMSFLVLFFFRRRKK